MRKIIATVCLVVSLVCMFSMAGCGSSTSATGMKDGTYTAQMEEYSFGWREYVTVVVKNGQIVTTEYNAENPSGLIKSWDNEYMTNMKAVNGTYPNEYTRYYAAQLTGSTKVPEIEALSGATSSGANFKRLSAAVVEQAMKGDSAVVYVAAEE